MKRTRVGLLCVALLCVALFLSAAPARGQLGAEPSAAAPPDAALPDATQRQAASPDDASLARGDRTPDLADSLFAGGHWDGSVTEYKRFLFLHGGSEKTDRVRMNVGLAYRRLGRLPEALETFRTCAELTGSDSLRGAARLEMGRTLLAQGDPSGAELTFARLQAFARSEPLRRSAGLEALRCEIRAHRWEEARTTLTTLEPAFVIPQADSLLGAANAVQGPSPATAASLSRLLPGLGQLYAGSPGRGLHSFLVNASFAWWTLYSLKHRDVPGVVISVSFLRRYYRGSSYHASRLAVSRRETAVAPIEAELLRRIDRLETEGARR